MDCSLCVTCSYTQTTIHVLLWYEVRWQVTHRLQSMSYSSMRFVDKLHTDYNPCLTPVWGSLTSYTQTTIHVLLRYEVRWQVTHRLQSMSYSGMRFVDKLHTDYNPCLTLVWGLLTSYTQTTILDCNLCVTCQRTSYRSNTWIVVCV
jgi:hypothetical protein